MYKKKKAIMIISGDYCAFHETTIKCQYVYGHPETMSEKLAEYAMENSELFDMTEEQKKELNDNYKVYDVDLADIIADRFIIDECDINGGYWDCEKTDCLAKLDDDCNVVSVYYKV